MAQHQASTNFVIRPGKSKVTPVEILAPARTIRVTYDCSSWPEVPDGDLNFTIEIADRPGEVNFRTIFSDTIVFQKQPGHGGGFLDEGELSVTLSNPIPAGHLVRVGFDAFARQGNINTAYSIEIID